MCPSNGKPLLYKAIFEFTGGLKGQIWRTVCSDHSKPKSDEKLIEMNPVGEEDVNRICEVCRR